MVRTQLYLPEATYKKAREQAKVKNISFAEYARVCIDEKLMQEPVENKADSDPFFGKWCGALKGAKGVANNEEIDKFLYGY